MLRRRPRCSECRPPTSCRPRIHTRLLMWSPPSIRRPTSPRRIRSRPRPTSPRRIRSLPGLRGPELLPGDELRDPPSVYSRARSTRPPPYYAPTDVLRRPRRTTRRSSITRSSRRHPRATGRRHRSGTGVGRRAIQAPESGPAESARPPRVLESTGTGGRAVVARQRGHAEQRGRVGPPRPQPAAPADSGMPPPSRQARPRPGPR